MPTSDDQKDHQDCGKWIKIEDVHTVMASMPSYKEILFSDGKTKLLDCIASMEKPSTLKRFFKDIADINTFLPSDSPLWPGCTPLHLAVMFSKNMENENKPAHLVKLFLDQGPSVQVQDKLGATPLHLALRLELQPVLTLLLRCLEKNAKEVTNLLDSENLSYLHIFCTASDHRNSLARVLLSDKRKIESTVNVAYKGKALTNVKPGWTPLHVAADQSQLSLIELLLQQGADLLCTDARGYTAIDQLFGTFGTKAVADVLFASEQLKETRVKDVGSTHLHVAVWFDDVKTVERLLDLGADIEAKVKSLEGEDLEKFDGCSPLYTAMLLNHFRIVEILLDRGADVLAKKYDGTSPLSNALTHRQFKEKFVRLIRNDAKLQQRLKKELGLTTLHIACSSCDFDQVEEELKRGIDVNSRLHDYSNFWMGYTPLHVLATNKRPWYNKKVLNNVLRILLDNNCDIDQQDSAGKTALHLAIQWQNITFADALLEAGIDVNIVDRSGKSALSFAVELRSLYKYRYDLDNVDRTIVDLLLHLYKMQLVEIEVSELNETLRKNALRKVTVNPAVWNESAFCDQVQATDKVKIGVRGLTLRSFLRETHAISMYPSLIPAYRTQIDNFFRALDDRSFPGVISLLRLQYRKAVARLSLINHARYTLKTLLSPSFPELCVDMILKYLSNSQMKQLIAASVEENTG